MNQCYDIDKYVKYDLLLFLIFISFHSFDFKIYSIDGASAFFFVDAVNYNLH